MEKRHITVLTLVAALGMTATAAPLTPEQALTRALATHGDAVKKAPSSASYALAWRSANSNVYCFNRQGGGFVVAAGDDSMGASLLGYGDTGKIDPDNLPPAMADMLEAFSTGRFENARTAGKHENISPLLQSLWAQETPYNNDCPRTATGEIAVCGCAATAISQVLNHFKYPDCGTGTASATFQGTTVTADLDGMPIDWDNILDDYSGSYSATEAAAVANLVYVTGLAINMEYGLGSSGASVGDCVLGVTSHLRFDKSMRSLRRDFYTVDEWNAMIHGELASDRPVCYFGFNQFAGHAFVIDGYENTAGDYFHVNWGWAGLSNGYFLLTDLSPESQGTGGSADGYNKNQEAFFDMLPDHGTPSYRPVIGLYGSYGVRNASILKSKDPEFCATQAGVNDYQGFYNVGLESVRGNLGIRCRDTSSGEELLIASETASAIPVYGRMTSYSIKADDMPGEGEYVVTPMFRIGDDWYDVSQDASVRKTLTLTVTDSRFKFKTADPSGIEEIADSEDDACRIMEIYDMQGIRVENPQPGGIYMIRTENGMSKVRM